LDKEHRAATGQQQENAPSRPRLYTAAAEVRRCAGVKQLSGTSVSALAIKYGVLDDAAAALGFSTVQRLQDAIQVFCAG